MPADHVTIKADAGTLLDRLDHLGRRTLVEGVATEMRLVAELGKRLLGQRVPRRTGALGKGWDAKVFTNHYPVPAVLAVDELQPKVWYGRLQNEGWVYHPQGLHFIEKTEAELEGPAAVAADRGVKRAVGKAGL
jgi:hypothetical protein